MKTHRSRMLLGLGLLYCLAASAIASTPSSFQSNYRPLGLPVMAQVQLAGSDSQSQAFQALAPGYVSYIQKMLPEGVAFTGSGLYQLDPRKLYFMFSYAPRVYYVYEGACYNNALGATIATASSPTNQVLSGNTFTIFPFVHSSIGPVCTTGSGKRSTTEPLILGDWVQLPTVNAGQQLAFFVMADMNSSSVPARTYYNGSSNNPDNFQHLVAFLPDQSQYIIIGFEDMFNGGDKDCNDVMFVVDVGPNNAAALRNSSTLPQ
ncbi:MAG: DUF4114 domain-containing protein [Planctomycetes bacterium]|nr:DUF4114 domain-containing protein [Planctomycetota bacterium]